MATLTIDVNIAPAMEALRELVDLIGDGSDLPDHILGRVTKLVTKIRTAVDFGPLAAGRMIASPSGELLAVLAVLRGLRQ